MTRVEELTLKLADGQLSDAEFDELERLVREDPTAARIHLELLELEADLRGRLRATGLPEKTMQRLQKTVLEGIEKGVMDRILAQADSKGSKRAPLAIFPSGPPDPSTQVSLGGPQARQDQTLKRPTTRRSLRRPYPEKRWWMPALVAAGFLAAVMVFFAFGPSGSDTAASGRKNEAQTRARKESEARRTADPERERVERQQAQAKRRDAEARLEEIRRNHEELARSPAQPGQHPGAQERRKAEEKRPANDTERIEREMREAIGLARKTGRPSPTERSKEEKLAQPQEPPKEPKAPQGTLAMVVTVERMEGEVYISGKEGKTPAQAAQGVSAGQGVETAAKSFLVLKYPDGTRLEMGDETVIRELKEERGKRLFVEKGAVRAQVAKQPKDQNMLFTTPHGEAKVLGTTLRIVVDPDPKRGTRLEVEEGRVELKRMPDGKTVDVPSGHYAVAAMGAASVAKPLPIDEILLSAPRGKIAGPEWKLVKDEKTSSGFALESASPASSQVTFEARRKLGSYVMFTFKADADKEYRVWVRAWCTTAKNRKDTGEVILEVAEGRFVPPDPHLGNSEDKAFDFDHFWDDPAYGWQGGNQYPLGEKVNLATVKFSRSGQQTMRMYVGAPSIRVDALWLSAIQTTRPDSGFMGPGTPRIEK